MTIERDDSSAPFFEALARAVLTVRQCAECGKLAAPQVRACPTCSAPSLDWTAVSGFGKLISWTVLRDRTGAITAVGGIVELVEGPWLRARLVDDPAVLGAGLPLRVEFEGRQGGEYAPVFRQAAVADLPEHHCATEAGGALSGRDQSVARASPRSGQRDPFRACDVTLAASTAAADRS
ncbi:OB-fold domain-containing protein [Streptomyces sp. NPDC096097]|uniref:Zn-ribbon domain-containing OB-fold protein n=1 Tax=Streptomyces sp. NPDC096097 TaxID=3155546 RepID=UPI00331F5B33